uniref:EF-hand domain-containing protein n=1 Tax=Panagrellus redivivus TaxID=6233 RepID=A0A7E4V6G8_PANRE
MKQTPSERQRVLERQFGTREFQLRFGNAVVRQIYWALRRFQFWLCWYDNDVEIDLDDLLTNPFNTQPPSLDELQKLTGFRREWLMFVYRNFKQICSNGRMNQNQWRQIFRLIFKGAADYDFADRFFLAIAGTRSQKLITFEDLIFCLYDICVSCNEDPDASSNGSELHHQQHCSATTTAAQFTFNLMLPDHHGRVSEAEFVRYAKSIFDLNASLTQSMSASGDAATFGMMHQMSMSGHSQSGTDKSGSSKGSAEKEKTVAPSWVIAAATKQFRQLDVDGDGYITLTDVQRIFEQKDNYESLHLQQSGSSLLVPSVMATDNAQVL